VVGSTHITKPELRHEIRIEVRAIELGSESCTGGSQGSEDCADKKGAVPPVGTAASTATVVEPVVAYLVADAQLHGTARRLSVVVTHDEIKARITTEVQRLYGGNQAEYRADLKKHGQNAADVERQVKFTLVQRKIDATLRRQVRITPADVLAYYTTHRQVFETDAATRRVDYVLLPSRAAATRARVAIASGKTFAAVASGALDDSSLHEPFVATAGNVDRAFLVSAFSLPTTTLSPLVPVDRAYAAALLEGKCKPTCYFIIRPTADVIEGGTPEPFASVRAEIKSRLLSILRLRHVRAVIGKLEKEQKRLTRYAPGYAPRKTSPPSTGVPDTDETTAPT
jgi:hypothetical protein